MESGNLYGIEIGDNQNKFFKGKSKFRSLTLMKLQRSSQAEHVLRSHSVSGIQYLTLFTRMGLLLRSGLTMTLLLIPSASMQENKHPSLPTPRYIPAGFDLRSVLWNPTDGFGGGDNEREMIYVKGGPDRITHQNLPLQVTVSSDLKHEFAYTEKADSSREIIYMDDGTELKGKYFDGQWMLMRDGTRYWDSEYIHSLVFDYRNFHVGIRAPRQKVSFEELFRIAGSFAHS